MVEKKDDGEEIETRLDEEKKVKGKAKDGKRIEEKVFMIYIAWCCFVLFLHVEEVIEKANEGQKIVSEAENEEKEDVNYLLVNLGNDLEPLGLRKITHVFSDVDTPVHVFHAQMFKHWYEKSLKGGDR